jgi:hypothetical protein
MKHFLEGSTVRIRIGQAPHGTPVGAIDGCIVCDLGAATNLLLALWKFLEPAQSVNGTAALRPAGVVRQVCRFGATNHRTCRPASVS